MPIFSIEFVCPAGITSCLRSLEGKVYFVVCYNFIRYYIVSQGRIEKTWYFLFKETMINVFPMHQIAARIRREASSTGASYAICVSNWTNYVSQVFVKIRLNQWFLSITYMFCISYSFAFHIVLQFI